MDSLVKCTGVNPFTKKVCALTRSCLRYLDPTTPQVPGAIPTLDVAPFHGRPRHSRRQPFLYCRSYVRETPPPDILPLIQQNLDI